MSALLIIFATIIIFLLIGVHQNRRNPTFEEFFLMGRSATSAQYADTTVGYSLQVAVTVYFVFWGYKYGWSNIFFIVSWSLGLVLFALAAPRIALALSKHETMFALLANDNVSLKRVSAFFFLSSLVGLIYTELYFSSQFLANAASVGASGLSYSQRYWPFFFLLLICSMVYAGLGGVRKVVITEKIQLVGAYLSLAGFFWLLRDGIAQQGASRYIWTYGGIAGAYLFLALGSPIASWLATTSEDRKFTLFPEEISKSTLACSWICAIWMGGALFIHQEFSGLSQGIFPKPFGAMLSDPFGWAPILGFGLANLIWQFSDYTAYHRLILLDVPEESARASIFRKSIASTAVSSPITWALGIFTGMAIDASNLVGQESGDVFTDFYQALVAQANHGNAGAETSIALLGVFFICVMLSTVDSAFVSAGKMIVTDICIKKSTSAGWRGWMLVAFTLVISLIGFIHVYLQMDVFVLLNGIYSWGLIFGPVMLYRLFASRFSSGTVIISLVVGAGTGAYFSNNPFTAPELVAYVLPTVSAVAITTTVLLFSLVMGIGNKRVQVGGNYNGQ